MHGLVLAFLFSSLVLASSAPAVTFTVTSSVADPDADLMDGVCAAVGGACTWQAAQDEVLAGIHTDFVIRFDPTVTIIPSGRFTGDRPNLSVAIQGPIKVDIDAVPRKPRGLHFIRINEIRVSDVWITGNGTVGDFDNTETGIDLVYDTAPPASCVIERTSITGVDTPFRFGSPLLDIPCTLTDNRIGIDPMGNQVGNQHGIVMYADATVVSGNTVSGVQTGFALELWGDSNVLSGNNFGTDASGLLIFGNQSSGVYLNGDDNDIVRNVLSNSMGRGIEVRGDRNDVYANRVGTNILGTTAMGNAGHGIFVRGTGNCIGSRREFSASCGPSAETNFLADRNVISNNGEDGIYVTGGSGNDLVNNTIGTDVDGSVALGNAGHGINITSLAPGVTIEGGLISANQKSGVFLDDVELAYVIGAIIGGRYFGGGSDLGNQQHGIYARRGSAIFISDLDGIPNQIYDNAMDGIRIEGDSSGAVQGVLVGGNLIGLDLFGAAHPNANGIAVIDRVSDVSIDSNLISGNRDFGVEVRGTGTATLPRLIALTSNYIGTGLGALVPSFPRTAVPNGKGGIRIGTDSDLETFRPEDIEIGFETPPGSLGTGNVISGNGGPGVWIEEGGGDISLLANYIGVDENMHRLPNGGKAGVVLERDAGQVVIGGSVGSGERFGNVISGNNGDGIFTAASGVQIYSNWIGTDVDGRVQDDAGNWLALGNLGSGIRSQVGGSHLIGGSATTGNLISGNFKNGISLGNSDGSLISFNGIGWPMALGGPQLAGNIGHGIAIGPDSSSNMILENVISLNLGSGVLVRGGGSTRDLISQNSIFGNARTGIELVTLGNLEIAAPTTSTLTLQTVTGTTCPNCTVEIFSDVGFQGALPEVAIVADGNGDFSVTGPFAGPFVTCTTYDALGNTSMFGCQGKPVDLLPALSIEKRVSDPNGDDVEAGDRLAYRIEISNQTAHAFADIAIFDELTDPIPVGAAYVPDSLTIDDLANDDDPADAIGYDAARNAVVWNGDLPAGAALVVAFEVDLDAAAPDGTEISNQAQLVVAAPTLAAFASALSSDDPNTVELADATDVIVGQPIPEPGAVLMSVAALMTLVGVRRAS